MLAHDRPRAASFASDTTVDEECDAVKIHAISVADAELTPFDLGSAEIQQGPLDARGHVLYERDENGSRLVVGIFACRPGKLTNLLHTTETIYVLEGQVTIEFESGDKVDLGPGDTAVFPAGNVATWTFRSPFKEVFVLAS